MLLKVSNLSGLIKTLEQAHDGFVPSRFAPAKQAYQRAIQARDVGMHKASGPTPDAHDHLLDELLGCIPPVGAGLWQIPALHGGFEAQAIEHALQKRQAAPSRHLSGGELHIKRILDRHTIASAALSH